MTDFNNSTPAGSADISAYQASTATSNNSVTSPKTSTDSESLESQNIFELLGVNDGSDTEKETFLDELQRVIWQDFLDNDLQLLLTKEELTQIRAIQAKTLDIAKQQEEIVVFVENLVPDLEGIILEKALELKREMVRERISGLREYLSGQADKLAQLQMAEDLIKQNKWSSATVVLNKISN